MRYRLCALALLMLAACGSPARPRNAVTESAAPASAAPASAPSAVRIAIIGASVSAGFVDSPLLGGRATNDSVALHQVIKALWGERVDVRNQASIFLYRDPTKSGRDQVKRAIAADPALVLAIDFLFWFGYGAQPAGSAADEDRARLAHLEEALALLDEIRVPIIIGDYPDMTGADPRMLGSHQIPSANTLAALNRRLYAWAGERPHVHVFPLAEWMAIIRHQGYTIPWRGGQVTAPASALLQGDGLHASRLGMALLGHRVQNIVTKALTASQARIPPDALGTEPVPVDVLIDRLDAESAVLPLEQAPAEAK